MQYALSWYSVYHYGDGAVKNFFWRLKIDEMKLAGFPTTYETSNTERTRATERECGRPPHAIGRDWPDGNEQLVPSSGIGLNADSSITIFGPESNGSNFKN